MKLACIDVIRRENAACQRSGRDNDMDLFGNLGADLFRLIIRRSDCHESVCAGWIGADIQRRLQNR